MSRIALALAQASVLEVEVCGLQWRIRAITSRELAEANAGLMLIAAPALAHATPDLPEDATEEEQEKALKKAMKALMESARRPEAVTAPARFNEALVCAGVVAVSDDGEAWDTIRLVADERRAAPAVGRMFVGTLPPGALSELASHVLNLSTDEGEASKRLAGFLGGEPGAPGLPGEAVPPPAE